MPGIAWDEIAQVALGVLAVAIGAGVFALAIAAWGA